MPKTNRKNQLKLLKRSLKIRNYNKMNSKQRKTRSWNLNNQANGHLTKPPNRLQIKHLNLNLKRDLIICVMVYKSNRAIIIINKK